MTSRYDFMKSSGCCDEDGLAYPDIFSEGYNFSDFALEEIPTVGSIAEPNINKFWMFMQANYDVPYLDDVLLNLNGIPYVGALEPGSKLYLFKLNDMISFNTNKLKDREDV